MGLNLDTKCQSGTDCEIGEKLARSRCFDRGFVNQQNRDVVLHPVYPLAGATLKALWILSVHERVPACRADQNLEQVLGNHGKHSTPIHHRDTEAQRKIGEFCN
jgi:hypothetical protein